MRQWLVRHGWGVAVGCALTLAAVLLHVSGMTERLEMQGYDYHVRHFSRIPASENIVHIDIDDASLERVASWPWPRDYQADLVRILNDLGARRIVMDIVLSEPKEPRVNLPSLERYAELEGEIDVVGDVSEENIIYQDDELAAAIRQGGNVWLSMFHSEEEPDTPHAQFERKLRAALDEDVERTVSDLAEQVDEAAAEVEAVLASIKRQAIQTQVDAWLDSHPKASARETHEAILSTPFERLTADREDLLAAYHRALCMRQLRATCPPVPEALRGRLPKARDVTPPIYKLTAGAEGVGIVSYRSDSDGWLRHIPLLLEWDGRLLEQLGFAAARRELGIGLEDLSIDSAGHLVIRGEGDRAERRIQLNASGKALINWHVARGGKWENCFDHQPVTLLMQIRDCRQRIRDNEALRDYHMAAVVAKVTDAGTYQAYCDRVNRLLQIRREIRKAEWDGRDDSDEIRILRSELESLRQTIAEEQKIAIEFAQAIGADLQERRAKDPEIQQEYEEFAPVLRRITEEIPKLEALNAEIAREEQRQLNRLRPKIEGKVCFIGYTATAVADMVTTPAYDDMPGVLVHSNVYNSMMQGQFRSWSSQGWQITAIVLFGMVMTFMAVLRGPRESLAILLVIVGLTWLLSTQVSFARFDFWIGLLLAVVLTFVIWAMIVLVRYLITDRQRRRFSKAVAQYVSPAMARRIADDTEHLDLSPREGEVTCLFSDLAGFTRISEHLGPEGTKTVLNPYLERMSEVLHQHNALINKFMGDGIFAFFNPPILACEAHALAACESALDSRTALKELVGRYAQHPLADYFGQLSMRIGIASGHVFVGDYGSENKLDYTCVGDTVNLAARLESANKQFDSGIMISHATREAAGDRYELRHLGALQVKGQSVNVHVYELLGRRGELDSAVQAFVEEFNQAVDAFAMRDWDRARRLFEACIQRRPADAGAMRYLEVIQVYSQSPPGEDWQGGLELTEK